LQNNSIIHKSYFLQIWLNHSWANKIILETIVLEIFDFWFFSFFFRKYAFKAEHANMRTYYFGAETKGEFKNSKIIKICFWKWFLFSVSKFSFFFFENLFKVNFKIFSSCQDSMIQWMNSLSLASILQNENK